MLLSIIVNTTRGKKAQFRFYEELNDFLPPQRRKSSFVYSFCGTPSVKDAVQALGVPHTEIDLILVNGTSVGFDYLLQDSDLVSVYPVFESLDISGAQHLRPEPLRDTKFVLDCHLGKLARLLRLCGFDSAYSNTFTDEQIVAVSVSEKRIVLTRDRGILKRNDVTHGYCPRSEVPEEQLREVISRFQLESKTAPFTRCLVCNGLVKPATKESVASQLEPGTAEYFNEFYRCTSCSKVYWRGSHYEALLKLVPVPS